MRPWRNELLGFVEKLRYKLGSKESPLDGGDAYRFHLGIFVGFCPSTGLYISFANSKNAVAYARTVQRLPDDRKWDSSQIEAVSVTPYQLHAQPEQGVTFTDAGEAERAVRTRPGFARRIYLRGADFTMAGFTDGCPRYDHARRYDPGRTTRPHSEECRARVIGELAKTPEGLARINKATTRAEETIAQELEHQDRPAHGEIVVPDEGLRMPVADARVPADDLRFDEREIPPYERAAEPAAHARPEPEAPPVHGGAGRDPFDTTDFHDEVNVDVDQRAAAEGGMDIDTIEASGAAVADGDVSFAEYLDCYDHQLQQEARQANDEILEIVGSLGGNVGKY